MSEIYNGIPLDDAIEVINDELIFMSRYRDTYLTTRDAYSNSKIDTVFIFEDFVLVRIFVTVDDGPPFGEIKFPEIFFIDRNTNEIIDIDDETITKHYPPKS